MHTKTRKALGSLLAFLLAFAATFVAGSQTATAAPGDGMGPGGFAIPGVTSWYGQYHLANGAIVYCADLNSAGPTHASGWTSGLATSFQKQTQWTPADTGYSTVNGPMMTAAELASVAWALSVYGNSSDPATAAAVEHYVRINTVGDQTQADREAVRWAGAVSVNPGAQTAFETIANGAMAYAGPYTMVVQWDTAPTTNSPGSGHFQLLNGQGVPLPSVPVTLSYAGGAFTSADPTTGSGTGYFTVPAGTADADATVSASVGGLANRYPTVYTPLNWTTDPAGDGLVQRMLGPSDLITVSGQDPAIVEQVGPSVTTKTKSTFVNAGSPLTDIVTVSGGVANASFSGTSTLYGPLATEPTQAATAPAGTPTVGTATFTGTYDANGAATVETTALTVPSAGYYVWQETLTATPNVHPDIVGPFGAPTETSLVYQPTITTAVSTQQAAIGLTISDTVTVAGIQTSVGGKPITNTVTGVLAGPVTPLLDANGDPTCTGVDWSNAPTALTLTPFVVTGDGSTPGVGSYVVTTAGCYSYGETLTVTYDGATIKTVNHPVGDVTQTTLAIARLAATTQTKSVIVKAGGSLTDTVNVVGGTPNTPFKGTAVLYGPLSADPTPSATAPAGTPIVGTATFSGTFDANGAATVETTALVVPAEGYYTWQESITATTTSAGFKGQYGVSAETTLAYNPTIATQVSAQHAVVGSTISDTVIVGGIRTTVGGVAITNTVTGFLYGPMAPLVDANGAQTCVGVDWTHAPEAATIPAFEVTANGSTPGVGSFQVAKEGCYTYYEVLNWSVAGGGYTGTVEHDAGLVSQTALVTNPAMSTQVSAQTITVGGTITDTIVVTGAGKTPGVVTATNFGPMLPEVGKQCSSITDQMWRDAIAAGTVKPNGTPQDIAVTGDGTYTTAGVKVAEVGCYTWYESAVFTGTNVVTVTPYGVATETTLVINPAITTLAKASSGIAGAVLVDDVYLTGTFGAPGTITGYVMGPVAKNAAGTCEGLDWSTAAKIAIDPIKTTGDGTYVTNGITAPKSGCWTFVETWTADDKNVTVVNTLPGEPTETLYLAPKPGLIGSIDSGVPDISATTPAELVGMGLVLILGLGLVGRTVVARRRTN